MALRSGYASLCQVSAGQIHLMKLSNLSDIRINLATRQGSMFHSSSNSNKSSKTTGFEEKEKKKADRIKYKRWGKCVLGGLALTASIPVVVGALGFGAGGVVAGSVAASMQSAAAGTALTGSMGIGALQSIGAAGLTFSQGALTTFVSMSGLNEISKTLSKRKKQKSNGASSEGDDNEDKKETGNRTKDSGTSV